MPTLHFRITARRPAIDRVVERLVDVDGIRRVDALTDVPQSTTDVPFRSRGVDAHAATETGGLQVEFDDASMQTVIQRLAEIEAREAGARLETVDRA